MKDYKSEGGEYVAKKIGESVELDYLVEGKLKDLVSKKLKIEKAKKDAFYDKSMQPILDEKLAMLDECKPIFKNYSVVGADSTAHAVALLLGVTNIGDYEKFAKGFKVDIHKDLVKELDRADNRFLLMCIYAVILIFMMCSLCFVNAEFAGIDPLGKKTVLCKCSFDLWVDSKDPA